MTGFRSKSARRGSRWTSSPLAFSMHGPKLLGDNGFAVSASKYRLETARDFFNLIISGVRLTLRNQFDDRHSIELHCRCISKAGK